MQSLSPKDIAISNIMKQRVPSLKTPLAPFLGKGLNQCRQEMDNNHLRVVLHLTTAIEAEIMQLLSNNRPASVNHILMRTDQKHGREDNIMVTDNILSLTDP